jgi:predicted transposase YbfD/YdcC
VPAIASSLIATLARRPHTPDTLARDQCRDLLVALAQLPDPRARRGRRHTLVAVLATAIAAVLAGHHSLAAIAEWAQDAPQAVLATLGVRRHPLTGRYQPPREATVRQVLTCIDAAALEGVLGRWLAAQQPPRRRPPPPAGFSGRSPWTARPLRGSGSQGRSPVHLLAAMEHANRAVLAQTDVEATTNEITRFRPLLEGLELTGAVVTADAMHTQREHAEWLVGVKHAAYLLLVKGNQPVLRRQLERLPWADIPVLDVTRDRAHGRSEIRRPQVATVAGLGFPHATQALRITRRVRRLRGRRWRTVTVYGSPTSPISRPAPPAWPTGSAATGASRRCTTSATSPSPRTPARCAPATPPGSWRPCATWSWASCSCTARPTSPPRCAATPATPPAPWPSSASLRRQ